MSLSLPVSRRQSPAFLVRAGALVAGSTLVLTAGFVGLVALATGEATGVTARLPAYVLAMAVTFVATVILLEERRRGGETVLLTAGGLALAGFAVVGFGGEGITYALRYPDRIVASQLLFYFLAAGLIATGLGYWGARHWRELANTGIRSGSGGL